MENLFVVPVGELANRVLCTLSDPLKEAGTKECFDASGKSLGDQTGYEMTYGELEPVARSRRSISFRLFYRRPDGAWTQCEFQEVAQLQLKTTHPPMPAAVARKERIEPVADLLRTM